MDDLETLFLSMDNVFIFLLSSRKRWHSLYLFFMPTLLLFVARLFNITLLHLMVADHHCLVDLKSCLTIDPKREKK